MANNYLQFSIMLPLPESEGAQEAVKAFYDEFQKQRDEAEGSGDPDDWDEKYDLQSELSDGKVWIYADETGSLEAVVEFIQEYLEHFQIDGGVYFSWAETCSKPRVNEFAGGAFLVTRDQTHAIVSSDVIVQHPEIRVLN